MTNRLMSLLLTCCILTSDILLPVAIADDFSAGQQWSRLLGTSSYRVERRQHFALPADAKVWIVGEVANVAVGETLQNILGSRFATVYVSHESMDLASARQHAAQQQSGQLQSDQLQIRQPQGSFLFYYRVQQFHQGHWHERTNCSPTFWRGGLCRLKLHNPIDKVQFTVWVWDVSSERLMDTINVQAASSVLSGWNQSPTDLMAPPLRQVLWSYSANIN